MELKVENLTGWKLLTMGNKQRLLHFGEEFDFMPTMSHQVETMQKIRLLVTYDDTFNLKRLRDGLCVLCKDDIVFVSSRANQKALRREFEVIEVNESMAIVSFELCRVGRNTIQIQSQRLNRGLKIWTPWSSEIFSDSVELQLSVGRQFHPPSTKFAPPQVATIRTVDSSITDKIMFYDIYGNKITQPNPDFTVELRSQAETCTPVIRDALDGTYDLTWQVQSKGRYQLYINGEKTNAHVSVLASEPSAAYTYITTDAKVIHVGEPLSFMIHLYDKHNNPIERGDLRECGLITESGLVDADFPMEIAGATQEGNILQVDNLRVERSNILRGVLRNPQNPGMVDLIIQINGQHIQDSPYGVLYEPKPPKSFVERIQDFYAIKQYDLPGGSGTMSVRIQRTHFIDSVVSVFEKLSEVRLRNAISVVFVGEEGMDCGGLTREFFDVLTGTLVSEGYFEEYGDYIRPSQQCVERTNVLYIAGCLYAKAVLQKYSFGISLPISLCKRLKYEALTPDDFRLDNPQMYKSLHAMAQYSPEDLEAADLNFTVSLPNGGTKELIPNGENILVNHENLQDYIDRMTMWRMDECYVDQAEIFCTGFRTVLSECLLDFFDPHEWQQLLAGKSDAGSLKRLVEYHQCSSTQQLIKWFWTWLETHGDSCVRGFLKFTTGSSVVPVDTTTWKVRLIHDRSAPRDSLPTAATCFNEIRIPTYTSYNELTRKMNAAIIYGSVGFDRA